MGRDLESPQPELRRHYLNVGQVAVAAAWVEEAAAGIVAASTDDWDANRNLRFARSKQGLLKHLEKVAEGVAERADSWVQSLGDSDLINPAAVSRAISDFRRQLDAALKRRDKVVHAVVRTTLGSPTPQLVHPRSLDSGGLGAVQAIPADGEIQQLCFELNVLGGEARNLAARVLAVVRHD